MRFSINMKLTKSQLYKRQTTLPEIGEVGQQKLQNAAVLVVGCGGLGSPIAVHLAASGIGHIHLVDFDTIDATNLHRQVFYSLADVGKSKAATLANFIKNRAPYTEVTFSDLPITKKNIFELIEHVDIVIDGTDSLPTKYLLNDTCVLNNKPLVYGSLYKFDGYVGTFNVKESNENYTGNLRDAFPEIATDIPNCTEAGTLNTIVGIIALQQVNEVLKLITGVGKLLTNQLLIYNSLENSQFKMKLTPTFFRDKISKIFDNETYFDASCEVQNREWVISAEELKNKLSDQTQLKPVIISVIEKEANYPFTIDKTVSLSSLNKESFKPEDGINYVFVCEQGIKSYAATSLLKEQYPTAQIVSLSGGISRY